MPLNYCEELKNLLLQLDLSEAKREELLDVLTRSEDKWRSLSESNPDFVFFVDSDFAIEYSNLKSFGHTVEHIGKPLVSLAESDLKDNITSLLKQAKETGNQVQFFSNHNLLDGKLHHFESLATPQVINGKFAGFVVHSKDITKYKQVETALQERIKELNGLLGLGRLTEQTQNLPELLNKFVREIIPGSMMYPENVCVLLCVDNTEYRANDFACVNCLRADIFVEGKKRGFLQVGYNKDLKFIKDFEQNLIDGYSERLGKIIERLEASEKLKQSEQRFLLAQRAANIGSWEWDIETGNLFWSDTIETMFGFREGEFGKTYDDFMESVHPDDREYVANSVNNCLENQKDYDIEHRIIWPDGSIRWLSEVGDAQRDDEGKAVRMFGVVRDITERKKTERLFRQSNLELEERVRNRTNELAVINLELQREIRERKKTERMLKESREQLRELTLHIESVREKERTKISREIHDDLGQALTAFKLDLIWLKNRFSENDADFIDKADSMCSLVDDTIKSVQRISTELRPGLLDDLGLSPAIEWQISEFINRTGVSCKHHLDINDEDVPEPLATVIFRIFQEALTNIIRHAAATEVSVNLIENESSLVLEVKDNGRGITEAEMSDKRSFGIMGMKERIRPLKGRLSITGKPGKGTTVSVIIPDYKSGAVT